MYVWPTCPMEVKNILINSKPKLSAGFNEIPLKLLKSSPDNIIMALSHILNLSLSTGKVISNFKIAKIIPLYKKGNASDINNYRPISFSDVPIPHFKPIPILLPIPAFRADTTDTFLSI